MDSPENAAAYRAELTSLRRLVEKHLDRATNPSEKTLLFVDLAGLKAAIQASIPEIAEAVVAAMPEIGTAAAKRAAEIAARLIQAGLNAATPVAIIEMTRFNAMPTKRNSTGRTRSTN